VNKSEYILKKELSKNSTQLKHLTHVWIILSVKRCILDTQNERDPFENLKFEFKCDDNSILNLHTGLIFDQYLIDDLLVLYQMINFDLSRQIDQSYMANIK